MNKRIVISSFCTISTYTGMNISRQLSKGNFSATSVAIKGAKYEVSLFKEKQCRQLSITTGTQTWNQIFYLSLIPRCGSGGN